MKRHRKQEHGIALVIVLMMITIIIAVTVEFNASSRSEIYGAANFRDAVKLRYLAKSGFNRGAAFLVQDIKPYDALTQRWAKPEAIMADTENSFDGAKIEVAIEDESGKIPIHRIVAGSAYNALYRDMMIRFLSLPEFGLKAQQAIDIVDAIKDWMDIDEEVTGNGAESAYYSSLKAPYKSKNAPLDSVEELLFVKGITPELFHGTSERPGIGKFLTVHGDGKININTAPQLVLRALDKAVTEGAVDEMHQYRTNESSNLADSQWYRTIKGMAGINLSSQLVTTKSNIFQIFSSGRQENMRQEVAAIIERTGSDNFKVLSWKVN